jgi:hypothetical protein
MAKKDESKPVPQRVEASGKAMAINAALEQIQRLSFKEFKLTLP